MNVINRIFVYGTLIESLLRESDPGMDLHIKKKEKGRIKGRLFDVGEYPGAKPTTLRSKQVLGKIYEIDAGHFNNVLVALDNYEEYNPFKKEESLYVRKITRVATEKGSLIKAWVYWYNKPVSGKHEIETGDYQKYWKLNKLQ